MLENNESPIKPTGFSAADDIVEASDVQVEPASGDSLT